MQSAGVRPDIGPVFRFHDFPLKYPHSKRDSRFSAGQRLSSHREGRRAVRGSNPCPPERFGVENGQGGVGWEKT